MQTLAHFCLLLSVICEWCRADYYASSNYFCRDLLRQQIVDINQLEGMWYLTEKVIHTEERHLKINMTKCPIIHISEDRSSTTYNPLLKNYDTTYGAGYPHNPAFQNNPYNTQTHRNPTDPKTTFLNEQDYIRQTEEYDRRTTYDYDRRKSMQPYYMKRLFPMKYLKLYMTDGSSSIEHHMRYNTTNPGFWIMSGPDESVQDNVKHFAGTIQVLKAVGNHLVLTMCQSSRETKELYTMILSRENYLETSELHSLHVLLVRQGLRTNFIERSCNGAKSISLSLGLGLVVISILYSTN